jgi:hypothetical protein
MIATLIETDRLVDFLTSEGIVNLPAAVSVEPL